MPLSILRAASESPDRAALIVGGTIWTYVDLAERAGRIVTWLDRRKLRSGECKVALVPRLDMATVAMLLALIETGITAVLLHPRLTASERAELVHDASADLVLEDLARDLEEAWQCEPERRPRVPPDDEACLAILYTSGTTGRPKGAMLSRRAFRAAAAASAANLGWELDDRWLLCMPLAHVGGLSILVRSLMARRCVVIPESDKFDPDLVRRVVERDRVTICSFVPTMIKRLLDAEASPLPHVRAILLGGAAAPSAILNAAREAKLPVLTTYGLTEACSQVTTQRYGTPPREEEGSGPPVSGTEIRIGDGRIEVRGPSLMSGYHGLSSSPFLPGGWLRTEDFGRIDDEGRLHVLGRRQELLVTGGENVYPLEVERHLDAIHGIETSCVFGTPDETWGELVCAAIVLRRDVAPPTLAELEAAFEATLAAHKRPRLVAFVRELPTTPAGKLDRKAAAQAATHLLVPITSARR